MSSTQMRNKQRNVVYIYYSSPTKVFFFSPFIVRPLDLAQKHIFSFTEKQT